MIYALLLMFFFLEYVRPTSYLPVLTVLHLNSIVPLSAFVGTLVTAGPATLQALLAEINTKLIGGLMVLVWMSVLTADVQQFAFDAQTILLGFALIYWVVASEVSTVARVKGVIQALIVVHLVVAALNPVLFTDPGTRHYVSSGAFLGDGNDLALSLDIIVPLCLFLLLDARGTMRKAFWAGALAVLVGGIVATQSRGGTVGLVAAGLYYWFKGARKFQTAAVAVVLVGLVLALAPGQYFERISSIGDTEEGSAQGRIMAWKAAVRMAADNPLLGVGAAHFPTKIGNEYRPAGFIGSGMNAHSIYFSALGELGVPGFLLVVSLVAGNLSANRRLAKQVRQSRSTTSERDLQLLASGSAAMIALASAGAFLSALYYPHLYVLAGLLTAMRRVVRERCVAAPSDDTTKRVEPAMSTHWSLRPPVRIENGRAVGARR